MKVVCILTDGFEEIEAIGTIAILRRSKIDVDIFSLKNDNATGRYGINIHNLYSMENLKLDDYDLLFIAGGPQYIELENSLIFKNIILDFFSKNKYIAAICAGPTILGHLGLLQQKRYTCFNSMNEDFHGTFVDHYCVKDGNIITGKSAAATIEFAFVIVETLLGEEKANNIKDSIYYFNK